MPLNANCIWEIRTDGDDANGGAFRSGASGTDFSMQASAQKSGTDLTMHPTLNTRVQPVVAGVAAADVGNVINITAGTGWTAGWYEITSQDGTYWTLDRSPAAAGSTNSGTYAMGGALASPGRLGQALSNLNSGVSGMRCYIRSGTYTITTTTANVSGGRISLPASRMLLVEGYQATRGDLGTPPEINAGTQTAFTIFTTNGQFNNGQQHVVNLRFNGNNRTGVSGLQTQNTYKDKVWKCVAVNCLSFGFNSGNADHIECLATACGVGFTGSSAGTFTNCVAKSNTTGFVVAINGVYTNCLAHSNTADGFNLSGNYSSTFINCTSHANNGDGFDFASYGMNVCINCLATNNGGFGFNLPFADNMLLNCAGRNNTAGNVDASPAPFINRGFVLLTADPYQNAAGEDFRLNDIVGGGAAIKGKSIPVFGQIDYRDIGAVQSVGGGGGGGGSYSPIDNILIG